ncbi:uncharacterized protein LOC112694562 [Sipha flava]|uniref:Uncharacterized protein LOC112694562 n=1 Tax=Sipha flava TaxID=143950 RepID=A0A8B8GU70_9HEMI|nr:uncharacterized protein LOC112694562 [Sipha flava]XP_025425857.1 uncharacterized protein LOC112694562 [Sipha flava]
MYACYNNGLYSGYLIREQYARTRVFQHACILKEDILLDKDKNSFLSNKQFGFLKGKSTSDAHFFLNKYVHEHLDQNNKVLGTICLDTEKAFDCVNHQLLLKKLNYAGIRGIANKLISS